MTLPGNITTIRVTGQFLSPTGTPIQGTVAFVPSVDLTDTGAAVLIPSGRVTVTLDTNGAFSVVLPATDDPDLQPTGWTYTVLERVADLGRSYSISLPSALAPTVDLSTLAPVASVVPVLNPVTLTGAQTITGVKTFTASPIVPNPTTGLQAANKEYVDAGLTAEMTRANGAYDAAGAAAAEMSRAEAAEALLLPKTGGTVTGTLTAGQDFIIGGYSSYAPSAPLINVPGPILPPISRRPEWRRATFSQQFQTGHGWTASGSGVGSSNLNDTSTFIRGTQCATITSAGNGVQGQFRESGGTAQDMTGKMIRLILKVDDVTHLNNIGFVAGTSNFTNFFKWTATTHSTVNPNYVQSGEWVIIHLSWADVASASGAFSISSTGVPSTTSGLTDFEVTFQDDGAGTATVHLQAVELIPDTSVTFPSGVVSITFDDSYQNVYDLGRPKMDLYGYRGTLYTIRDVIGTSTYLTLPELQQLAGMSGWEVAGHAYTDAAHAVGYTALTAAQVSQEFRYLRAWMVQNGFAGDNFAYPHGAFGTTSDGVPVDQIAMQFWNTARCIISETIETQAPAMPYRLKSITGINDGTSLGGTTVTALTATGGPLDRCQLNGDWLILAFHQIIPGTPTDSTMCSQTGFATVMSALNARGIPVLPVSDVLRYYS